MNETMVTVLGYLGAEPEQRDVGDTVMARFRIGSTPRTFSQREGTWGDRETNWFTVNAWRGLGQHCLNSLHSGDPVIVYGRLRSQVWQDGTGANRTTMVIEAISVGHDLTRGVTSFLKDARGTVEQSAEEREVAAENGAWDVPGPQMTSDGRVVEQEEPTVVL